MKVVKILPVLLVSVIVASCGDSGSSGGISKSEAISMCRSSVASAVRGAGSNERDMMRAGDRALESCMAGYGYTP